MHTIFLPLSNTLLSDSTDFLISQFFAVFFTLTYDGALPRSAQISFMIIIGLVVGSFLNVVIYRLPIMLDRAWRAEVSDITGRLFADDDSMPKHYNLWLPRSACTHCRHILHAWENIPIASWFFLQGRCSNCKMRISARYPLVECLCTVCAVSTLILFGLSGKALAAFGLCSTLIVISAIDLDHQLLPDSIVLPLLWAGLIVNIGGTFVNLHHAVIGAVVGYLALWCVYWLFKLIRGIKGMGYGDFKLLSALGAWFGWTALPQIVVIAAGTGMVFGLAATWSSRMRFDEPLPFGPYLAAGGLITLVFGTPFYFELKG